MSDMKTGGDNISANDPEMSARSKQSERCKAWRSANPEKSRATWEAWSEANIERRRAIRARAAAKWRAKNPEKVKASRKAYRDLNREKIAEQDRDYRERNKAKIAQREALKRRQKAEAAAIDLTPREQFRQSLASNEVWLVANKSVPATLPSDVRDDVISSLCLAVFEGEISVGDIASRARTFVSAHYRSRDWWQTVSIDAPIFRGSDTSLLDVLEDGTP